MWAESDVQFLDRASRLAMNGRGWVEPNPMVGCVIVKNDRIIGEGFHSRFGSPHAEPTALSGCTESPNGATAYVTLEPCCHTHKKTPPCVPLLIEHRIARVVIGCVDPNPQVNGNGIRQLKQAGIEVDLAPTLVEARFKQLISPFILRTLYDRPYVTMKWAQTSDGKVAGHEGMRLKITDEPANRLVHWLRTRSDAIVVGINTVLNDDPSLTVRGVDVIRHPERIILDRKLRTPTTSQLVRTALLTPTVVVTSLTAPSAHFEPLVEKGVRVVWPPAEREDLLQAALRAGEYVKKNYTHVLIEPGPTLASAVFRAGICDRLWVFESPQTLDDPSAPRASTIPPWFELSGQLRIGQDLLYEYLNTQSPAYFTHYPSVDFLLTSENHSSGVDFSDSRPKTDD
ncbi:MAG: riboflavin biosynthesis protein RibD [Phycisphaerae bacterium]|jgi:diaminohydroxyphosphoribosylaminopyrimidine deaminase/5-amino-6-(5-phosphoribosylamino)uracil reductase|nr:MAG: riboflavin biosynthesis protein RibD [Phycisphaerae bacterium]